MVTVQPRTATVTADVVQGHAAEDQFYQLSVAMTLICIVNGGIWSLMCTIPAVILAMSVSSYIAFGIGVLLII